MERSIEKCDIFDFMADFVGLTVLHPGGFKATSRLAELCHIGKDTKVLDIACGKGTSAVYLAQRYGCQVVGIDIADHLIAQAIALAKRKGLEGRVSFRVADALDLPYDDGEFDVAFSQAILILVPDKKKAIQEALRVTRPGGYLGWLELSWQKEPTEEFIKKAVSEICAFCMRNAMTFEGWTNLFVDAGLRELRTITSKMESPSMIRDEGPLNAIKVIFKWLTNTRIRRRMNAINKFFADNAEYFGYGIYVGRR